MEFVQITAKWIAKSLYGKPTYFHSENNKTTELHSNPVKICRDFKSGNYFL